MRTDNPQYFEGRNLRNAIPKKIRWAMPALGLLVLNWSSFVPAAELSPNATPPGLGPLKHGIGSGATPLGGAKSSVAHGEKPLEPGPEEAAKSLATKTTERALRTHALQMALDRFIQDQKKHPAPGIAIAISTDRDPTPLVLVSGVRDARLKIPLQENDAFNLGSCTKAFNAVLLAHLVSKKMLGWKTTLGELGTRLEFRVHPAYRDVTIDDILLHRGGTPKKWDFAQKTREQAMLALLEKGPTENKGVGIYSDPGFSLLGYLTERIVNQEEDKKPEAERHHKKWDQLVDQWIFQKLEITKGGFQRNAFPHPFAWTTPRLPWELVARFAPVPHKALIPQRGYDDISLNRNLAPAAAIQLSMGDWNKFVRFLAKGAQIPPAPNPIIESPAAFAHLFEPAPRDAHGNREDDLHYGALVSTPEEYYFFGVNGGFTSYFSFAKPTGLRKTNAIEDGLVITMASNSVYDWSMYSLAELHGTIIKTLKALRAEDGVPHSGPKLSQNR